METDKHYTAFAGFTRIAGGSLETVLREIWNSAGTAGQVLIFDNKTGKQVDIDLRGSLEEVLARAMAASQKKGPGRPRLGVVSREVSLLPRHWEWLERQPQKASGTLRRLVEAARKQDRGETLSRETIEAADRFMWSVAGNLAGFEEVGRALYARNWTVFDELVSSWPRDIKEHLSMMVRPVRDKEDTNSQPVADQNL
jgi:hypothetical protein